MKCYVSNGQYQLIIAATSREGAARRAFCFWRKHYPGFKAAARTRVSEIGFDAEGSDHGDDSVLSTKHIRQT
jgi:hypothetical protein